MLIIEENGLGAPHRFSAHVWFKRHSHQCAEFDNWEDASKWANWLHRTIATEDLLASGYKPH